jgi:hypothetical protein
MVVHGCVARDTALPCSRPQGVRLIRPAGRRADRFLSAVVCVRLRQKTFLFPCTLHRVPCPALFF